MAKELNKDYKRRDELIFGDYQEKRYEFGGIYRFECNAKTLSQLVEEGFADPNECQNSSPMIKEFLEYTEDFTDDLAFECYAVSPKRDDYRISVEGVDMVLDAYDLDQVSRYVETFRWADEFSLVPSGAKYYLHAWWD